MNEVVKNCPPVLVRVENKVKKPQKGCRKKSKLVQENFFCSQTEKDVHFFEFQNR